MLRARRPARPHRAPRPGVVAATFVAVLLTALGVVGVVGVAAPAVADEQPHDPDATRILITGDSITQGRPLGSLSGGHSWRYFLWKRFEAAGHASRVDFVGHKTGPARAMTASAQNPDRYADPDFDYDHAAVSSAELCRPTALEGGVRIDHLVSTYRPDVIVSAWGINDLRRGVHAVDLLQCYDRWLRQARSANPDVDVVIARLPWAFAAHRNGLLFNDLLGDWAAARTTTRSTIVLAEMAEDYDYSDLYDGVHPNQTGEQKIASMMASSLAALGLPVQVDRPLLPGNRFAAAPPRVPTLRLTRTAHGVRLHWSARARSTGYDLGCTSRTGTVVRRLGMRATTLHVATPHRARCWVRARNASGVSRRSSFATG